MNKNYKSFKLMSAVRYGNFREVSKLLFACSLSHTASNVLLCIAIKQGHKNIVKLLLRKGAKIRNYTINPSITPLHFAAMKGYIEITKRLLDKGAFVDANNKHSYTPLHYAVKNRKVKVVKLLLNHNAYIEFNTENRETPLYLAAEQGNEEIVKLLLQSGADIDARDDKGNNALSIAIEKGYSVIVEDILKHSPDLNSNSNRSILNTAVSGWQGPYQKIVELLLQYGVIAIPEDADNSELLLDVLKKGYVKIVPDLIKHGVDVNVKRRYDNVTFHIGVKGCYIEIIRLLLDEVATVNATDIDDRTPLHIAVQQGYIVIIKLLLDRGADVDATDIDDATPLHIAVQQGYIEITKLLLDRGANVNGTDEGYITPLHIAIENADIQMLKLLLSRGVNVNATVFYTCDPFLGLKTSALHIAVQECDAEIVEFLLEFGADIDCRDEFGMTAFHIACDTPGIEMILVFLDHGCDVNIVNNDNQTPLERAIQWCEPWIDLDEFVTFPHYSAPLKVSIIQEHIIRMKTANLFVSKQNLELMPQEIINNYQNICENEMKIMKRTKIGISNVSFCDILTDNISRLAMYAKNENIVEVLRSKNYKTMFPVYARMINYHFEKGIGRKKLQKQCEQFFYSLFINVPFKLPCNCVDKILYYLSNNDLRILIDVCKSVRNT